MKIANGVPNTEHDLIRAPEKLSRGAGQFFALNNFTP
jgi:hypothetical protein